MVQFNPSPSAYLKKIGDQVTAGSNNPRDRYHLGKLILQQLKQYPDVINQIDGRTGASENNGSILTRSVRLASALRNFGLRVGDVVMLMAPNHLELCIPYYASFYIGAINMAVNNNLNKELRSKLQWLKNQDRRNGHILCSLFHTLNNPRCPPCLREMLQYLAAHGLLLRSVEHDLTEMLQVGKPKIIFCQPLKALMVHEAITSAGLDTEIVVFGDNSGTFTNMQQFSNKCVNSQADDFRATDFNPEKAIAFLVCTSGTTGFPKAAMITHQQMAMQLPYGWAIEQNFPKPTRMMLVFSPLQWITAQFCYIYSAIFVVPRLQTSELTVTQEHAYYLINQYRPTWTLLNCHLATMLLQSPDYRRCDFSSLETIFVGGGAVPLNISDMLKTLTKGEVMDSYGMSEAGGFTLASYKGQVRGSSGVAIPTMEYKIVDLKTGEELGERQKGELLIKGPSSYFKGYYKNEKASKEAFAEGGWFRTGDIFYRDGEDYFFVDRIKMMLEYKHHLISPIEVELVIRQHPGVADVAVGGFPHAEDVDHITACVVRRTGSKVTAQDIKDLVKDKLDDTKLLRGGVIFLDQMPLMNSSKLDRMKIKDIIMSEKRF